jgi:hypothetical protein
MPIIDTDPSFEHEIDGTVYTMIHGEKPALSLNTLVNRSDCIHQELAEFAKGYELYLYSAGVLQKVTKVVQFEYGYRIFQAKNPSFDENYMYADYIYSTVVLPKSYAPIMSLKLATGVIYPIKLTLKFPYSFAAESFESEYMAVFASDSDGNNAILHKFGPFEINLRRQGFLYKGKIQIEFVDVGIAMPPISRFGAENKTVKTIVSTSSKECGVSSCTRIAKQYVRKIQYTYMTIEPLSFLTSSKTDVDIEGAFTKSGMTGENYSINATRSSDTTRSSDIYQPLEWSRLPKRPTRASASTASDAMRTKENLRSGNVDVDDMLPADLLNDLRTDNYNGIIKSASTSGEVVFKDQNPDSVYRVSSGKIYIADESRYLGVEIVTPKVIEPVIDVTGENEFLFDPVEIFGHKADLNVVDVIPARKVSQFDGKYLIEVRNGDLLTVTCSYTYVNLNVMLRCSSLSEKSRGGVVETSASLYVDSNAETTRVKVETSGSYLVSEITLGGEQIVNNTEMSSGLDVVVKRRITQETELTASYSFDSDGLGRKIFRLIPQDAISISQSYPLVGLNVDINLHLNYLDDSGNEVSVQSVDIYQNGSGYNMFYGFRNSEFVLLLGESGNENEATEVLGSATRIGTFDFTNQTMQLSVAFAQVSLGICRRFCFIRGSDTSSRPVSTMNLIGYKIQNDDHKTFWVYRTPATITPKVLTFQMVTRLVGPENLPREDCYAAVNSFESGTFLALGPSGLFKFDLELNDAPRYPTNALQIHTVSKIQFPPEGFLYNGEQLLYKPLNSVLASKQTRDLSLSYNTGLEVLGLYTNVPPIVNVQYKFVDTNNFLEVPFIQSTTPFMFGQYFMEYEWIESFDPTRMAVLEPVTTYSETSSATNSWNAVYYEPGDEKVYTAKPGVCVYIDADGNYVYAAVARLIESKHNYSVGYESIQAMINFRVIDSEGQNLVKCSNMEFRADQEFDLLYVKCPGGYRKYELMHIEPSLRTIKCNTQIYYSGTTVSEIDPELVTLSPSEGSDRFVYDVSMTNAEAFQYVSGKLRMNLNDVIVTRFGVVVITQEFIDFVFSEFHVIDQGPLGVYKFPTYDSVSTMFAGLLPPTKSPEIEWKPSLGQSVYPIATLGQLSYGYSTNSFGKCQGLVLSNIPFEKVSSGPGAMETIYRLGKYPEIVSEVSSSGMYLYVPSLRIRRV